MRPPAFKGNIAVSNLPIGMNADQLADLFDQHGLVLGAKIDRWHDRPGGGTGLVDLAPDTAVEKAVEALNGFVIDGIKLTVRRADRAAKAGGAKPPRAVRPVARPTPPSPAPARPAIMADDVPVAPSSIMDELEMPPPREPLRAPARPSLGAGSMRQVVVEYRAPRRVVLPPRKSAIKAT